MALPQTIFTRADSKGYHPPFKTSGGSFYIVGLENTFAKLAVYKADSDDPTSGWTEQDAAGSSTKTANVYAAVLDGNLIHIVAKVFNGVIYYAQFNTSTDVWDITDEDIETPTNQPTLGWVSIAARSDGDVVVAYAGDTDQVMGSTKERVDANVRTGGTWGGPIALDAGADVHYGNPNCVLGTNDFVHCLWQTTANIADPPTAWTDTQGRSIDPADDSLSAVDSSTADTTLVLLGHPNVVSYDDAGTQRIIVSGFNDGGQTLNTAQAIEDANDEILLTAGGVSESFAAEPGFANGEVGISTFVALNADIHCLYSGDGLSGADQDLWYTTSIDDGASWSAPAEEIDAITVNFISANIYVRGSDTVLAYVYDDGGTQKYNEKVLIAGAADLLPAHLHRANLQAVKRTGNF